MIALCARKALRPVDQCIECTQFETAHVVSPYEPSMHKPCLIKNLNVPRDGRERNLELGREFAQMVRSRCEKHQNVPPCPVRQRMKQGIKFFVHKFNHIAQRCPCEEAELLDVIKLVWTPHHILTEAESSRNSTQSPSYLPIFPVLAGN
jgi:hypothetical protein